MVGKLFWFFGWNFFLHISSSLFKMRLHIKNQLGWMRVNCSALVQTLWQTRVLTWTETNNNFNYFMLYLWQDIFRNFSRIKISIIIIYPLYSEVICSTGPSNRKEFMWNVPSSLEGDWCHNLVILVSTEQTCCDAGEPWPVRAERQQGGVHCVRAPHSSPGWV